MSEKELPKAAYEVTFDYNANYWNNGSLPNEAKSSFTVGGLTVKLRCNPGTKGVVKGEITGAPSYGLGVVGSANITGEIEIGHDGLVRITSARDNSDRGYSRRGMLVGRGFHPMFGPMMDEMPYPEAEKSSDPEAQIGSALASVYEQIALTRTNMVTWLGERLQAIKASEEKEAADAVAEQKRLTDERNRQVAERAKSDELYVVDFFGKNVNLAYIANALRGLSDDQRDTLQKSLWAHYSSYMAGVGAVKSVKNPRSKAKK